MKDSISKSKIYFPLLILVSAATATIRAVACIIDLDYSTGYFDQTTLISISNWIVVAAVVLLAVSLFVKDKSTALYRPSFKGPLTYLPSGVLAVAFLFLCVSLLEFIIKNAGGIFTSALFSHPSYIAALLGVILALCGVCYSALCIFVQNTRNTLRADFGILTALFFAVYTTFLFFSTDSPINLPAKIIDEMTYLSAAVFFLCETRISIGRERRKQHFVFGAVAVIMTAYSAIPSLTVYILKGEIVSNSIQETMLTFAVLIFTLCRLIAAYRWEEDKPSSFAAAIDKRSAEAETVTAPETEQEENPEPPQITIDDIERIDSIQNERQSEE